VAGPALLHELGEDARCIGRFPLLAHAGEDHLPHALALPEGYELLPVAAAGLLIDPEKDLFAAVEDLEVLEGVAAEFWKSIGGFGRGSAFADDQFAVVDADFLLRHDRGKDAGAQHRGGEEPGFAVDAGDDFSALGGKCGYGLQALFPQQTDAFGHHKNSLG